MSVGLYADPPLLEIANRYRVAGQWAPIAGAGLAVLGSLYLLLAADLEAEREGTSSTASIHHHHHCNCSMQEVDRGRTLFTGSTHSIASHAATEMRRSNSNDGRPTSLEIAPTITRHATNATKASHQLTRSGTHDVANRRKVARALNAIGNQLGTAAHLDDSEFKHGKALDFPEIPGEEHRNRALPQIRTQYNLARDDDGNVTPLRRPHSRAGSFTGSVRSGLGIEGIPTTPTETSPPSPRFPFPSSPTTPRANTLPVERSTSELHNMHTSPSTGTSGGAPPRRRDTLEVPSPVHHSHTRNSPSASSITARLEDEISPAIVVSPEPEMSTPADSPVSKPHAPPSPPPTNDG